MYISLYKYGSLLIVFFMINKKADIVLIWDNDDTAI